MSVCNCVFGVGGRFGLVPPVASLPPPPSTSLRKPPRARGPINAQWAGLPACPPRSQPPQPRLHPCLSMSSSLSQPRWRRSKRGPSGPGCVAALHPTAPSPPAACPRPQYLGSAGGQSPGAWKGADRGLGRPSWRPRSLGSPLSAIDRTRGTGFNSSTPNPLRRPRGGIDSTSFPVCGVCRMTERPHRALRTPGAQSGHRARRRAKGEEDHAPTSITGLWKKEQLAAPEGLRATGERPPQERCARSVDRLTLLRHRKFERDDGPAAVASPTPGSIRGHRAGAMG